MTKANTPQDVFKHINMENGDANVCWEWKGKVNKKDGRPYYTVQGKRKPAYVYVLELHTGQPQQQDQVARHKCDNKICCNPHHLSWGTHQHNMDDMKERDRHGLPATVVRSVHNLLEQGRTQQSIADLYGISREAISAIATGRNKSHVDKTNGSA
jgi:hypothetical protein